MKLQYRILKDILDRSISFILILFLIPFMAIIWMLIKITSNGAAIFHQKRVGLHMREFEMYKFRTMKRDTPDCVPTLELAEIKDHTTAIGTFLRKTSIDELPQLFNILRGDMSLIGPRPVISKETSLISIRDEKGVYNVKPGLTGYAQINGRDNVSALDKAIMDEYYMQNISFWFDLRIVLMTIGKVLKSEDIYGGEQNEVERAQTSGGSDEVAL